MKEVKGNCLRLWGAVLGERGWWLSALSALSVLACAHVDRFEADMLVLAAEEPAPLRMRIGYGDVDRLFTCG